MNITCMSHVKDSSVDETNSIHLGKDLFLIKPSDFFKKEIDKISTDPTSILTFK